jgi:integrase
MECNTREEQLEAISNIPESHRDPILFAMNTGIRPGELVAILIKSVDIKRRFVWIERAKSGPRFVERTKNKESLPVPLNDTSLEIVLRNMKKNFPMTFSLSIL